jgi:hypothetical protein
MWFALTQPPYGTSMPQSRRRPQHQKRKSPSYEGMSALPLKADIECNGGWLRLVADSEADNGGRDHGLCLNKTGPQGLREVGRD